MINHYNAVVMRLPFFPRVSFLSTCSRAIILYLSKPGIEPRSLDLQENTLPCCCKSRLLPQVTPSNLKFVPEFLGTGIRLGANCRRAKIFYLSQLGIEPRSLDLQVNTLPGRCKSRLLPQGSRSVSLYSLTLYHAPPPI